MLWLSFTFLALFASVQGRAVNISNTWVLPEEGFPVFYRYFRDRISWYEADAVCQFHHANLVTVDTTAQYDAVRAYLKELDISSAVWVGLIRSNPDGDFTWTDYRGLSGDGYWSSAPDVRAAPLCAAADPAADYRWEARSCGGPTVASFICELPVPQWALGNDGCMVRALPALTVLYLPESAAVQLTADCGLAGVKRVQCTGNVKRQQLLKDLSCNDDEDPSSTLSLTSASTMWPITDTTFTDQETEEISTENNIATEYKETSNTIPHSTETPTPIKSKLNLNTMPELNTATEQTLNTHGYIKIPLDQNININPEPIHSNNIVSNDIPQLDHLENSLTIKNLKKVDNSKNFQHRLLHDEMTRLGNLETIFTQPTDHFVPPLVMAKARISNDMTVLSLEEKHAQQIAEQRLHKYNMFEEHVNAAPYQTDNSDSKSTTSKPNIQIDKQVETLVMTDQNNIKKIVKSSVPKKYNDKYENLKGKVWKTFDNKIQKTDKLDIQSDIRSISTTKKIEMSTLEPKTTLQIDSDEDPLIDLTVIIKEPDVENGQKIFYTNHSNTNFATNVTNVHMNDSEVQNPNTEIPFLTTNHAVFENNSEFTPTITLNHEIIKITVVNDKTNTDISTPIVFEVSTLVPVFNNTTSDVKTLTSRTTTGNSPSTTQNIYFSTEQPSSSPSTQTQTSDAIVTSTKGIHVDSVPSVTENLITINDKENIVSSTKEFVMTHETTTDTITVATSKILSNKNVSENINEKITTTLNPTANLTGTIITEKIDVFNNTESHSEEEQDQHESDVIDDYQSPLLSAANEPLHRPNRARRPLPPSNRMNKFNPFRILG